MFRALAFATTATLAALLTPLAFSGTASAHGPTPQKMDQSITIAAPAEKVWAVVGDFAGIAAWNPAIKSAEATGGTERGATRSLTLEKGAITESLDSYSAERRVYSFRLSRENVAAFPVSFYTAKITVTEAGDESTVRWIGRFYRGDTGNFPSPEQDDAAATTAMTDYIETALAGLKTKVEGEN
ncbi:MxaD family protein [Aureimonas sp. SA4125]|uniref:SRPBCC family protein n=1 Tax=Aureimonas sp. SA4125 TaxID=2826993 RepID=UPI001CC3AE02|nr:SRPBCC family protein [Aureimonas sp. SA4125]BDA85160.1 MxaD family protein [Aureimonas sp. SA4125]